MDAELARRLARECVVTDGDRIVSVQESLEEEGYDVNWADILYESEEVRLVADEGILLDWDGMADAELERMHQLCPDAYSVACHILFDDYALADADLARPATSPLPGVAILSDSACDLSEYAGLADCKAEWLGDLAATCGGDEAVAERWAAQLLHLMEDPGFRRTAIDVPCGERGLFDGPIPENDAAALLASLDAAISRTGVAIVQVGGLEGEGAKCFVATSVARCLETSADFVRLPAAMGIVHTNEVKGDLVLDLKGALATVRAIPLAEVGRSDLLRELVFEDGKAVGVNGACFSMAQKLGPVLDLGLDRKEARY